MPSTVASNVVTAGGIVGMGASSTAATSARAPSTLRERRSERPAAPATAPTAAIAPEATRNRRRSGTPIGSTARRVGSSGDLAPGWVSNQSAAMPAPADTAAAIQAQLASLSAPMTRGPGADDSERDEARSAGRERPPREHSEESPERQGNRHDADHEQRLLARAEKIDAPPDDASRCLVDEQLGDTEDQRRHLLRDPRQQLAHTERGDRRDDPHDRGAGPRHHADGPGLCGRHHADARQAIMMPATRACP